MNSVATSPGTGALVQPPVLCIKPQDHQIDHVDFIGLDFEGAKPSVAGGVSQLLGRHLRPVTFIEVKDIRTRPWGCSAQVQQITGRKVRWECREEACKGDHICYISTLRKVRAHFPKWQIGLNLDQILEGIVQAEEKQHGFAQRT